MTIFLNNIKAQDIVEDLHNFSVNIDDITNRIYTWENSCITFLDNCKMEAFGEGHYKVIGKHNIIAWFGSREHDIIFNEDYTSFTSTRKDDLQIVIGNLEKL